MKNENIDNLSPLPEVRQALVFGQNYLDQQLNANLCLNIAHQHWSAARHLTLLLQLLFFNFKGFTKLLSIFRSLTVMNLNSTQSFLSSAAIKTKKGFIFYFILK